MPMPTLKTIIALILIVLGCGAWYGVWIVREGIVAEAAAQQARLAAQKSTSARDANQARTRALITETAEKRAQLAEYVHVDLIRAAETIEKVGPAAGVTLKVSGAFPETLPAPVGASAHPLRVIGFTIEAQGSFAGIVRAAELLETLPLPASIMQFDMAQVPQEPSGKGTPQWRLNARIRVLTDNVPTL